MAKQTINIGTAANDSTGDPLRTAFGKANSNITEIYNALGDGSAITLTSTAAELNILDGVTSTAAELNILDGATLSTTELNYVDGVTSAIQTQLDAKAASSSLATVATSGAYADLTGKPTTEVASNVFYVDPSRSGSTYTRLGTFNSPYNTITAAISAAVTAGFVDSSPAEVVLMGNITENVTLKPGIYLTSYGTGTHGSPTITGAVTITSSTGTTVTNHYSISNLRIVAPTNGHCINFTGTAPQKLFIRDMWMDGNGTGDCIYMDNTGSGSTLQMDTAHLTHSGSGDIYCINVTKGGCYVTDIETSGATQVAAVQTGAVLTIASSELDANGDVVCETYGTGSLTITNSSINNTQANSTGIKMNDSGGVAIIGNCLFNIPAGTGYSVQGVSGSFLFAANNYFLTANTARSTAISYTALSSTWSTKT